MSFKSNLTKFEFVIAPESFCAQRMIQLIKLVFILFKKNLPFRFSSRNPMKHETLASLWREKEIMTFLISFFCNWNLLHSFADSFFAQLFFLLFSPIFFLLSALASEFPSLWELNVYVGVAGMCDGILCCLPLSCFSHLFSNLDLKGEWVRTNFCVLCIHVT